MSDLADKIREQAAITGEMIIKADSRTGSTHMTDREEWGRLMAEQLAALSREVMLRLVAGAREAIVKEIVALLEHEHGWKLQVPAGDLEPPIKGCWCGFECNGLDEFNEHLLTVAAAAMTSDRYGKQGG